MVKVNLTKAQVQFIERARKECNTEDTLPEFFRKMMLIWAQDVLPAKKVRDAHLLTTANVANVLGFAPETVKRWRRSGDGPPFVRVGSKGIRYKPDDVWDWLKTTERPNMPTPIRHRNGHRLYNLERAIEAQR